MILGLNINKQLPWLAQLPANWSHVRLRELFELSDLRSEEDAPQVLSLTLKGIVERDISSNEGQLANTYLGYKKIFVDDIVFNPMDLLSGYVAKSKFEGVISPAYSVIRPRKKIDLAFFTYYFQAHYNMRIFHPFGKGVSLDHRWELKDKDLLNFPIILPPYETQKKISLYLDKKLEKIDLFVKNKNVYIGLLREQKQAIVNNAVTKGICDNVPLKPSGINWLDKIPANWAVGRLKSYINFNPGKSVSEFSLSDDDLVVFLPMENVSVDGKIDCSNLQPYGALKSGFTYFEKGDVVVAKITPCFENGKGAHLKDLSSNVGFGTTEFHVLRPIRDKIIGSFLYLFTMTHYFRSIGKSFMTGSAGQQRISTNFVKNFPIGLPPIDEQRKIVDFILQESKIIDKAIHKTEQQIELIKEYKTSLITNAVTGQLEIKE